MSKNNDNRANQLNPNHNEYKESNREPMTQSDLDNHSNQLNPNHDEYKGDETQK